MKPTPSQEARAAETIAEKQITLDDWLNSRPIEARGATCDDDDAPRLNAQCLRVYGFMRDLRSHTLAEIAAATGDPQPSVSARIREIRTYLRKGNKGTVKRERVPGGNGLHVYTLTLQTYSGVA